MKKTILALLCMVLLLALNSVSMPPSGPTAKLAKQSATATIDNTSYIDVNNILMFVTNHGNFCRDLSDLFGYDAGTFFPYVDTSQISSGALATYALYASGLWIGGRDSATSDVHVTVAEYSDEYVPGNWVQVNGYDDDPSYRVYKLYRDSLAANPNTDYLEWPYDQGAPWDTTADGDMIPAFVGDQMLWSVYHDGDSSAHTNNNGETDPMDIEIRQTTFGFDRQGSLGNIVFVKFQVFNKGSHTFDSTFISLWSDPDLGDAADDYVGCDTLLSVGYVYNADNDDANYYEDKPPCVGYDFFQGPLIETGDMADTALMWDTTWAGYKNMGMYSFNKYINGTDPDDHNETYNYMRGLTKTGDPYTSTDPSNAVVTRYYMAGDPVAGTGELDAAPADRRFMISTGPITFRPGDSTEIICALIFGQGNDRLESITVMKELDVFAQKLYESGFNPPPPPAKPVVEATVLDGQITLSWTDTSEVDQGGYAFEGYTVWQGASSSGPWTELATYDLINGNTVFLDTLKDSYSGELLPSVMRALPNTGLDHHYTTSVDAILGGPLYNMTDYYFRVTAFSFAYFTQDGDRVPNGDRFLESQWTSTLTPQKPIAGTNFSVEALDTIAFVQASGASDGVVYPLVLDPFDVGDYSYMVDFGEDTVITPAYTDTTVNYDYVENLDT